MRRRNEIDVYRRYLPDSENTLRVLRRLGIACYEVSDLNHAATVDLLKRLRPDYGIAAVDHRLSPALIGCFPTLLNAHYGNLPQIKGWNATEWSILLHGHLTVCLHEIVERMDAGRIYLKETIAVDQGDDFEILRSKCQDAAKRLYLRFFERPDECKKLPESNADGENYYLMHWQLKALAQKKLLHAVADDAAVDH